MQFVKVDQNKIKNLNPNDIDAFIRKHHTELTCEDRYHLEARKSKLIENNRIFIEKFFSCEIMSLAYKQAYKKFPSVEYMTNKERQQNPDLIDKFMTNVFDNAQRILKYTNEQVKQTKRRAKRH